MVDPGTVGVRIASSVVTPLVRKLFVREGPGAGLVERPVRMSSPVSFKGEKRTLEDKDLRKLVRELVRRTARDRPLDNTDLEAVTEALSRTLCALGDLDLEDVEAVRLGHEGLAGKLYEQAGGARLAGHLSEDSVSLYSQLLHSSCLHILHFLTQRSTFVARTLVEQSRRLDELIARTDILIERLATRSAEDAGFEERYAACTQEQAPHDLRHRSQRGGDPESRAPAHPRRGPGSARRALDHIAAPAGRGGARRAPPGAAARHRGLGQDDISRSAGSSCSC